MLNVTAKYADLTCGHSSCEGKGHYVLEGRCTNCGWTGVLWITYGHTGYESTSNARCPRCECKKLQAGEWVWA